MIIILSNDHIATLEETGATPTDIFGNWKDRRVTPCRIVTKAGDVVDPAMVCIMRRAPDQSDLHFRSGSEIADIEVSRFALPLDVRIASGRADEMRMGFSPCLIEMPDGKRFVMNGMTSFMDEPGYRAADARVVEGNYF